MNPAGKTHKLSFRVSDAVMRHLEVLRNHLAPDEGKELTLSDAARECIAQRRDDSERLRDFYHLSGRRKQTMQELREKILHEQELSRSEWEFLINMAHDAYSLTARSGCDAELLSDVLKAFAEIIRLRRKKKAPDGDRYYLGNLLYKGRSDLNQTEQPDVLEAVEYTLAHIQESPFAKVNAEFMIRNLVSAIRDETSVHDAKLDRQLVPYRMSIFKLAARGYYAAEGEPYADPYPERNHGSELVYPISTSKTLNSKEKNFYVMVQQYSENVSGLLSFESRRVNKGMSFVGLEDLVTAVSYTVKSGDIELIGPSPGNTNPDLNEYMLSFPCGWRIELTSEEYTDLRTLIDWYRSDAEVQKMRENGWLLYGAV